MMKTTTSNSMRVKARRDAWDSGGAGREDSSSIGFATLSHVDDQRLGRDRPTSRFPRNEHHSAVPTSCGCLVGPNATFDSESKNNLSAENFKRIVEVNGVS